MEAGRSSKFLSLGMTRNSCFYKIIIIIFGRGFGQDYGVSSCFCPEESGKGEQLSSMSSWLAIFQLYNRSARSVILGDNSCIAFGSYWPYQEVCSSSATSSLPRLTCVWEIFLKRFYIYCVQPDGCCCIVWSTSIGLFLVYSPPVNFFHDYMCWMPAVLLTDISVHSYANNSKMYALISNMYESADSLSCGHEGVIVSE